MTIVAASPVRVDPGCPPVPPVQASLRFVRLASTITEAFAHLLHRDVWSPAVSPNPAGCWACVVGSPVGPMCAACQLRASRLAAVEGAAVFQSFDHPSSARTHRWGLLWN